MWDLYGGGYWVAFAQVCVVYYTAASILHFVVPALFPVASVQAGKRKPHQTRTEALNSIGMTNFLGVLGRLASLRLNSKP